MGVPSEFPASNKLNFNETFSKFNKVGHSRSNSALLPALSARHRGLRIADEYAAFSKLSLPLHLLAHPAISRGLVLA